MLPSLNHSSDGLFKLNDWLKKESYQTKVSFWGQRIVVFEGKECTLSSFAKEITLFFDRLFTEYKTNDFSLEEREAAIYIIEFVDKLDEDIGGCMKMCSFFTRILDLIQRIIFGKPQVILSQKDPFEMGDTMYNLFLEMLGISEMTFEDSYNCDLSPLPKPL